MQPLSMQVAATPATVTPATVTPATVSALADRAALLARATAPVLLSAAVALHAAYCAALSIPEAFARGGALSRSEASDLVERSIRAEIAVALGLSERAASGRLEQARLLMEDLPRTREALAGARILWEAGEIICAAAALLPSGCRAALDERAADAALTRTPTQLRRVVARWRDELHDQPFAERHTRARQDRCVWIGAEIDGMATLCALLPATIAVGAYNRIDRIARTLRDGAGSHASTEHTPDCGETTSALRCGVADGRPSGDADQRTLAQLRADALADLLTDGDIAGTAPINDGTDASATFVPGIRADVRLTLAASTAVGLDDAPADLDGYGPVPADVARALVGTAASLTRVLTDPDTRAVLSVGRTHRLPPSRMRLHLQLRDRTCRFPGCTRPASTSEADHLIEWRHGGETSLYNLASLCTGHHHVRHGDRWTYRLHPDGTAEWTTPTGRRVTLRPPALESPPSSPPSGPRFADAPPPF